MLHHPSLPAAEANLWLQTLQRAKKNCTILAAKVLRQKKKTNSMLFWISASCGQCLPYCHHRHLRLGFFSCSDDMVSALSSRVFKNMAWNVVWWKLAKPCQGFSVAQLIRHFPSGPRISNVGLRLPRLPNAQSKMALPCKRSYANWSIKHNQTVLTSIFQGTEG